MEHRLVGADISSRSKYNPGLHWPGPSVDRGSGKRRPVAAPGTLLGPEGSGDELDSFWIGIRRSGPLLVDEPRPIPLDNSPYAAQAPLLRTGDRPYVENYTVDASIFYL